MALFDAIVGNEDRNMLVVVKRWYRRDSSSYQTRIMASVSEHDRESIDLLLQYVSQSNDRAVADGIMASYAIVGGLLVESHDIALKGAYGGL